MPAPSPTRNRNLAGFGKSPDTKHQGSWISGTLILLNVLVLTVWTLSRLYKTESLKSSVSLVYSLEVPTSRCIWENVLESRLSICCQWRYRCRLQVSMNLLHSASIFGPGNSQPYLALALWLQWELSASPVLRGPSLCCKILFYTTWKYRESPISMVFISSLSLLREKGEGEMV